MIARHDDLGNSVWEHTKKIGKAIGREYMGSDKKAAPVNVTLPQQMAPPPEKPFLKTTEGKIALLVGGLILVKQFS